jgi:hypothetical protein
VPPLPAHGFFVARVCRYTDLRAQIMNLTQCSKRTAQLAITEARQQGWIIQSAGHYRLPL